jgi:hypothetical protein
MIWGEIVANLLIGVLGWLFLQGVLGPTYESIKNPCSLLDTNAAQGPGSLLHSTLMGMVHPASTKRMMIFETLSQTLLMFTNLAMSVVALTLYVALTYT